MSPDVWRLFALASREMDAHLPDERGSHRNEPAIDANSNAHATSTVEPQSWHRRARSVWFVALALIGLGLLGGVRIRQWMVDPRVFFLTPEAGAEWIRKDGLFLLTAYFTEDTGTLFGCRFELPRAISAATLSVRCFRRCEVLLDGQTIYTSPADLDSWKERHDIPIPATLGPGSHQLVIAAHNRRAIPCLWARSDELGVRTGPGWETSEDGKDWAPAALTTKTTFPKLGALYPSAFQAFLTVAPGLAVVFVLVFGWTFWTGPVGMPEIGRPRWRISAARVHWLLLAAWVALGANNISRIPAYIGFDGEEHLRYVRYVAEHRALPLATDGWQMFQAPLFYLLTAPWYALFSERLTPNQIMRVLRFLPLLCGLAQIEIAYRSARAVFPGKEDLQTIATVVGGLMPMQIYMSQVIGNEPLAGCLSALVVYRCLLLLSEHGRKRSARFFLLMGLVWGLALLSKMTALLLAPLVVGTIVVANRARGGSWFQGLARSGLVAGVSFLVAGWFYIRNWIYLGKPFIGGWDPVIGVSWWQNPSYRTWRQLASFGTALARPVYSGCWSLWDSLYSTIWLDGFLSGQSAPPMDIPWNLNWMVAGAWLALVPSGLLLAGVAAPARKDVGSVRAPLLFAIAAVALYLAAVVDLYVRLPIYSTAKASYTLGMLPCYALLIAAGAAPLLRHRMLRAFVLAALACWALAAYLAYFAYLFPHD